MKRTCSHCHKEKTLNKKHFQVVKSFKQGFSFFCLECDEILKKPKQRDKNGKQLEEHK